MREGCSTMAVVGQEIDGLLAGVKSLDGYGASDMLCDVPAVIAKLESLKLALVTQIDDSGVWRDDPNGTLESFLRRRHKRDHRESRSDTRAAAFLAQFALAHDAAAAGRLSRSHVDVMVAIGLHNASREGLLADFLPAFIDIAAEYPASVLRTVMRRWADQVDPEPGADDECDAHARRFLKISEVGDGVVIDGFFGKVDGAKIRAVFSGLMEAHYQNGSSGGDGTAGKVARKAMPSQQRADAFMNQIIDPILAGGQLPATGGSRATVTVTVPLARLEQPCTMAMDPRSLLREVDLATINGARLDSLFAGNSATIGISNGPGTDLLSAQAAQRLTCDCEIHRIVLDSDGIPLDVGRKVRTFPAHMRKALEIRDGGCVFPGCDRPPGWAEAHHIVHWAHGGQTSLQNAALLCSKHHHSVHANNHKVSIGANGRATVTLNINRPRL